MTALLNSTATLLPAAKVFVASMLDEGTAGAPAAPAAHPRLSLTEHTQSFTPRSCRPATRRPVSSRSTPRCPHWPLSSALTSSMSPWPRIQSASAATTRPRGAWATASTRTPAAMRALRRCLHCGCDERCAQTTNHTSAAELFENHSVLWEDAPRGNNPPPPPPPPPAAARPLTPPVGPTRRRRRRCKRFLRRWPENSSRRRSRSRRPARACPRRASRSCPRW